MRKADDFYREALELLEANCPDYRGRHNRGTVGPDSQGSGCSPAAGAASQAFFRAIEATSHSARYRGARSEGVNFRGKLDFPVHQYQERVLAKSARRN